MSDPREQTNRGRIQVYRERCNLGADENPLPRKDQTSSVQDVLPGIVKKLGLADKLWETQLISAWPQIVGEQLARHTRPGRFQQKTLIVFVKNSVWLGELSRTGKKPLLEKLQTHFSADRIQDLRFSIDPDQPC